VLVVLIVHRTEIVAKGLVSVLKNLTPKARGIFKVLAEFQLENPKEKGLSYKNYYDKCRELFLVNSELTMRSQLTEFRDHKVVSFYTYILLTDNSTDSL
jgi:origin recognition complex subunit 2